LIPAEQLKQTAFIFDSKWNEITNCNIVREWTKGGLQDAFHEKGVFEK